MRGEVDPQAAMFSYVSAERRVPVDHPLRSIKAYADAALKAISPQLDGLRKSRVIGIARTQMQAYLAASAYNLLRMAWLAPVGT